MNLPNSLTVTRICLVPLLVVVLLTKFEGRQILGVPTEFVGAAIFGLASLTDWADGYLARRRKQITPFGQFIDPLADKLLTLAALVSLVQMDLAPAWMVAVILGRDFAVTALRSLSYARGVGIPASPIGKIKMVRPGRGDPRADPVARTPRVLRDRPGRALGRRCSPLSSLPRLLPPLQPLRRPARRRPATTAQRRATDRKVG
jgi:CDP-diacylglycerol--glycerol-3-phosphate 3-phosphatidyltransferase